MKKIRFALLFLIVLLLPLPGNLESQGAYNTLSHLRWCKNEYACWHEIAHQLDQEGHWISRSDTFGKALQVYVVRELGTGNPSDIALKIITYPGVLNWSEISLFGNVPAELYADLFAWSEGKEGNMPELLRPYYDWGRAEQLEKALYGIMKINP